MHDKKSNKEVHDAPPEEAARGPLKRFTLGDISAAVFQNERVVNGETRVFHNVSVSRSYEKDGRYLRSHSFGRDDLPRLAQVLKEAEAFIDKVETVRNGI
jgi:hypothetical protein